MSDEMSALLWAFLGVFSVLLIAAWGALYLRLTSILDATVERLQTVAETLAEHGARLANLERKL